MGRPLLLNSQPQGNPLSLHTASVPPGHLGGARRLPGTSRGRGSGRGDGLGEGPWDLQEKRV